MDNKKESINQAKLFQKSSLYQEYEREQIDWMLKNIINLQDEVLELKIKKIGDLEQEIFELKVKNYDFRRAIKHLSFGMFFLCLPILFDISVKIIKFLA